MELKTNASTYQTMRRIIGSLVVVDVGLAVLGLLLYPSVIQRDGIIGAGAAALMVCLYGYLALYSPLSLSKAPIEVWQTAAIIGTIAGIWLGIDLLSNYFVYRDGSTNQKISLVVYGVYLILLMAMALRGSIITKRIVMGITSAFWYVVLAQLIWFAVEFGAYYLFSRTTVGMQFIQTEMQVDFARSGEVDFQTFVIGDFFGAGFFHLLLIGLVVVLVFGSIGAVVGKLVSRWR